MLSRSSQGGGLKHEGEVTEPSLVCNRLSLEREDCAGAIDAPGIPHAACRDERQRARDVYERARARPLRPIEMVRVAGFVEPPNVGADTKGRRVGVAAGGDARKGRVATTDLRTMLLPLVTAEILVETR